MGLAKPKNSSKILAAVSELSRYRQNAVAVFLTVSADNKMEPIPSNGTNRSQREKRPTQGQTLQTWRRERPISPGHPEWLKAVEVRLPLWRKAQDVGVR